MAKATKVAVGGALTGVVMAVGKDLLTARRARKQGTSGDGPAVTLKHVTIGAVVGAGDAFGLPDQLVSNVMDKLYDGVADKAHRLMGGFRGKRNDWLKEEVVSAEEVAEPKC